MATNVSLEVVNQLENGSIHSNDIHVDPPTNEIRSRKKRKIKVSVEDFAWKRQCNMYCTWTSCFVGWSDNCHVVRNFCRTQFMLPSIINILKILYSKCLSSKNIFAKTLPEPKQWKVCPGKQSSCIKHDTAAGELQSSDHLFAYWLHKVWNLLPCGTPLYYK